MRNALRHWLRLLRATVWLALAFARASWYFKNRALHDLAIPQPEALTSKEKRRLKHYFYGTTYLSAVFCILRGYPRTSREKHLFTNLAALAYFFDDLVDAFRGRDDSGILWLDNPEQYGQTADPRGLALHFLHNIYRELPPGDLGQFKDFMHRVFNVETRGLEIGNWKLPARLALSDGEIGELKKNTAEKGGCSVLLFRRVLSHPLSAAEQEALFQFGYLVQLCDDIFDLWHDRQTGTVTLATFFAEQNDVAGLKEVFEKQVGAVRGALALPPPAPPQGGRALFAQDFLTRIRETLFSPPWGGLGGANAAIHYLVSITHVCLRHYEDLQKKRGTLPLDDRAAMVVDMEKWGNRVRAARALLTTEQRQPLVGRHSTPTGGWRYNLKMNDLIQKSIRESIAVKQAILADEAFLQKIEQAAQAFITVFRGGGKALFCGNGGSAADAQHIAAELSGRFYADRPPLYAEALHVNSSFVTAVANDYGYDAVFARMVEAAGRRGDVLAALSTSGNSPNILKAIEKGKEQGMVIIGLTGAGGGKMAGLCDVLLNVPSTETPRIQEAHILIGHIVCQIVEQAMFSPAS